MARLRKKMQAAGTTGSAETSRHSPRDGFNSYFVLSLVRRAFWPPLRVMLTHQRVIPASGYQNHTTSPSASNTLVRRAISVHRSPPHVRDDAYAPRPGRHAAEKTTVSEKEK
jgi:hypothetical protein